MSQIDSDSGEKASIGVFTLDTDMVVRVWDAALESMTGIAASSAIGKPITVVIPDLESRGLLGRFELVRAAGTTEVLAPAFHKFLIRCPTSVPASPFSEMRQLVTISALRESEEIRGLVVVVEDVTERMGRERAIASRLQDADDAVRLEAAKALSKESSAMSREEAQPIIEALGDKNWRVRRKLVESLSRRSGPDAVAALLAAVREEHLDFGMLNSALQILQASSVDTAETLIEFLNTGDPDLRMQAALALGHHEHSEAVVRSLIDALSDENPNVRYHAIEALGKLKSNEAVEPLLAIAESGDFFLSFAALEALKHIGDVSIATRLLPLLDDHFLSESAVGILGVTGGVETVDSIVELLNNGKVTVSAATAALSALFERYDANSDGGQIAARFRQSIGPNGTSAVLAELDSRTSAPNFESILVAGWIDEPEVRKKLALLASDERAREYAIKALACHGDPAVPFFVEMLDSDDAEMRKAALHSLGENGSESGVQPLLSELRSNSEFASAAAHALGRSGNMAAFDGLVDALAVEDKVLRRSVVNALRSLSHPEKERRLLGLMTDVDPNVREAVIRIIGDFRGEEVSAAILASCNDPIELVRVAAIEQLAGVEAHDAVPILVRSVKEKSPLVRAAAVQVLGKFKSSESAAALRFALGDEDSWIRYFAVRSLAELGDVESYGEIRKLSEHDEAEHVRLAAAEMIAKV